LAAESLLVVVAACEEAQGDCEHLGLLIVRAGCRSSIPLQAENPTDLHADT
jgi:hypothetical protein